MLVRYKKTSGLAHSSEFNTHALAEVLTGDDSPFIKDLDVYIPSTTLHEYIGWVDMMEAFAKHYLINDNHNTRFFVPTTEEDMKRGYAL